MLGISGERILLCTSKHLTSGLPLPSYRDVVGLGYPPFLQVCYVSDRPFPNIENEYRGSSLNSSRERNLEFIPNRISSEEATATNGLASEIGELLEWGFST